MNNVITLEGRVFSKKNTSRPGAPSLAKNERISSDHIRRLAKELKELAAYWTKETLIAGALVSVRYNCVIAKSKRVSKLLCISSALGANATVRGVRFIVDEGKKKHIITHFVPVSILTKNAQNLVIAADYIDSKCGGVIDESGMETLTKEPATFIYKNLKKSYLAAIIRDTSKVESFYLERATILSQEDALVTIYKTGIETDELFRKVGIETSRVRMLDNTTFLLTPSQLLCLQDKAPYLIAMQVKDLTELDYEQCSSDEPIQEGSIEPPTDEPVVGVIDMPFYRESYYKDWVSYDDSYLNKNIPVRTSDCEHGTAVTSIIVDGPSFNENLQDGCGRFRVRHFAVAAGRFSAYEIMKSIRNIVAANRDIKVWNLSLGSPMEIEANFISPAAAELDRLQIQYDVVFVVAGTNKPSSYGAGKMLLGAPADSLNSIVVNSVAFDRKPASYTREGPVLSFFHKPDVAYFGGTKDAGIQVCTPFGAKNVWGTSFAAPWITRKVAFLMYRMHLSKEVAKALLIDAAAEWQNSYGRVNQIGYGIVPVHISQILKTRSDEIRFIISYVAEEYESYTYDIPVPYDSTGYPYVARATLCYFPECSRSQGVDYTNTEMDIHFGPIRDRNRKSAIISLDGNKQDDDDLPFLFEKEAREIYRKWDNVKHIVDKVDKKPHSKKRQAGYMWGMSVKMKERLSVGGGKQTPFAAVVTLKEIKGRNRYDDFVQACRLRGWNVTSLDVELNNELYAMENEELHLENDYQ